MNPFKKLAQSPGDTQALQDAEEQVAQASQAGYGTQGDNLIDWLSAGDYNGTETVEGVAAEWDADRD